jgi:FkbM family methyltransferase
MPTLRESIVAAVTRRYPFVSGCGYLANSHAVEFLAGPSHEETCWARIRSGAEVQVQLDDHVGRAVYFVGDLDPKLSWICSRLLRPGDTAIDIGANIGLLTFHMATLVGSSGRVHAFEPNPVLQERLERAIARNRMSQIKLHRVAVGREASSMELCVPRGNAGAASLAHRFDHDISTTFQVQVRPLDEVLCDRVSSIRLVKIDVEGFEQQVFDGAEGLFRKVPPAAILFEMDAHDVRTEGRPMIRTLTEMGYELFCLPRQLMRVQLTRIDKTPSKHVSHDVLALHRDHPWPMLPLN